MSRREVEEPRPSAPPDSSSAPSAAARLGAELEAALLRELARTWREVNSGFFRGALRPPVLDVSRAEELLGRWHGHRRTIELSLALLLGASWGTVVEVLKHEMAHQYVDEVLGARDETAHGPAFRAVCERMGIHPGAAGLPESAGEDDPVRARLRSRIAALLALAESPNLNEAKTAAALAQRLMLKHNLSLAAEPGRRRYGVRHLGRPSGRVPESDHLLAAILAEHFFVEAIWIPAYRPEDGQRGSLLEICGTPENLEIASYVHAFLQGTAAKLWRDHRRTVRLRSNRDRRTFLAGVMEGFRERLQSEKLRCREQGLVWVGDADLRQHHRRRHPHIRSVRLQGQRRNAARAEGRAAGRRIVLRRALDGERGSASAARPSTGPRLLAAPASGKR